MRQISIFGILFFMFTITMVTQTAYAQWNWPEDKAKAEEKNVLYTDNLKSENFRVAANHLSWLLENAPNLNASIYINGAKIYEALADIEKDAAQKIVYVDSALLMYDLRMKYFNEEPTVTDRKAYTAYKYKTDVPEYQGELMNLFQKTFELNGSKVMDPNTLLYMNTVRKFQKGGGGNLSDEEILGIYDNITLVLDEKIAAGGRSPEKIQQLRDQVDGILSDIVTIDCKFVENNYGPKFQSNPGDTKLARMIVNYSLTGKCTDTQLFLQAAEAVHKEQPDYAYARLLAHRSKNDGDFDRAEQFFTEAIDLSDDNTKKAEIFMDLADVALKRGQKASARENAVKAASADNSKREAAWTLIGDLYMSSFEQCKGGTSMVQDRGVFLAAYDAYQKAGNSSRMAKAKEGFPSAEEIFNEEKEIGQNLTVGCWINETVTIQKR